MRQRVQSRLLCLRVDGNGTTDTGNDRSAADQARVHLQRSMRLASRAHQLLSISIVWSTWACWDGGHAERGGHCRHGLCET